MKLLTFVVVVLSAPALAAPQESRLDKMGREVTERAAKDMKSKDADKRLNAVKSLSSWKTAQGTTLLIQGLSDPDEGVRAESARSLGTYDKEAEPARQALLKALDDPRPSVVTQAAEALERALKVTEKELGPARTRVLEEGGVTDRFLAARSLVKQVPAARLVDPILDYIEAQFPGLASSDYKARDASRNNLEIGETALQRLVKETRDRSLLKELTIATRDFRERNDIPLKALSLYEPRPEGWALLLVDQLETRDPNVLAKVISLMGDTATSASDVARWAPEVVRFEKHPDKWVRRAVVSALADVGGLASEQIDVPLRALASEAEADARASAAAAIGEIGDRDQATPAAGKRLVAERAAVPLKAASEKDPDPGVREKAARALGRLQTGPASAGAAASKAARARTAPAAPAERPRAAGGSCAERGRRPVLPALEEDGLRHELVLQGARRARSRDGAGVSRRRHGSECPRRPDDDSPLSFLLRAGRLLAPAAADLGAGEGNHESLLARAPT